MADTDKFNFYLVGMDTGSETPTGVLRSSLRVEIRGSGSALWVVETYAYLDGEEKQIQSFQFSRR